MENLPLCVECTYSEVASYWEDYIRKCKKTREPVQGKSVPCYIVRGNSNACGHEGKWFEKRQVKQRELGISFWKKILRKGHY